MMERKEENKAMIKYKFDLGEHKTRYLLIKIFKMILDNSTDRHCLKACKDCNIGRDSLVLFNDEIKIMEDFLSKPQSQMKDIAHVDIYSKEHYIQQVEKGGE